MNDLTTPGAPSRPASAVTLPLARFEPAHFLLAVEGAVATVTLNRPERKNPLTFESYRELADFFWACGKDDAVHAVVVTGAGGNFSSGGDVFEIIGPLVEMGTKDLTAFTRMTGELVKAMRACPQPIVAAVDGICAGAGAIIAMASDLRLGTARAKVGFLFNKVGLAGCDMGACAILPRIDRPGPRLRASLHRPLHVGGGGRALGLLQPPRRARRRARPRRRRSPGEIAAGPTFANTMTKRMLATEWAMSVEEAIEAEAVAQALCMTTEDFARAYRAFAAKEKPVFRGD